MSDLMEIPMEIPKETPIKENKIQPSPIELSSKETTYLCVGGLLTAILYTLCFTGVVVLPHISFTVFCNLTLVLWVYILNALQYIKNKKGYYFIIPIVIISAFNGYFQGLVYLNVIFVHILFAMTLITLVRDDLDIFSHNLIILAFTVIFNRVENALRIFKMISTKSMGQQKDSHVLTKIIIGIIISVPLLIVLSVLLLSADRVFEEIIFSGFPDLASLFAHFITIAIAAIYFISYVYNARMNKRTIAFNIEADAIISTTVLFMVNLLFLIFCIIQFAYLFNGGFMKLPAGLNYAEYAREGFFQLLLVTAINFSMIMTFIFIFKDTLSKKIMKYLLILLCVFTAMLIYSSFYRMNLYIAAYGYTSLRTLVMTFLAMEALLIIFTLSYFAFPKIKLFKYYLIITITFYCIANYVCNPVFLARINQSYPIDMNIHSIYDIENRTIENVEQIIDVYNRTYENNKNPERVEEFRSLLLRLKQAEDHWQNQTYLALRGRKILEGYDF